MHHECPRAEALGAQGHEVCSPRVSSVLTSSSPKNIRTHAVSIFAEPAHLASRLDHGHFHTGDCKRTIGWHTASPYLTIGHQSAD